ncbi:hypothetical protein [Nocardia brasiliensis]|uniref:hypothetical protein n=1 Tax=Nocardia brasiliensis TaxID=37326 RepID=UPI002454D65B|nr:hypothetical protein [Nocardia brasiliensis]
MSAMGGYDGQEWCRLERLAAESRLFAGRYGQSSDAADAAVKRYVKALEAVAAERALEVAVSRAA